ncbi:MAG: hypothetical protein KGK11_01855 [Sphingomonadales bacterium]|nr:hypothetical protein [Sphingomonadales bacterium]
MLKRARALVLAGGLLAGGAAAAAAPAAAALVIGRHVLRDLALPPGVLVRSATFTPSGLVLVSYAKAAGGDPRVVNLALVADDGRGWRPFFSARLPERPGDNGIRYMVFPDDRRIFIGDFVIECRTRLAGCTDPALLPVAFPPEVATGSRIARRWSEVIVAPDDRHVAWTTLLADHSAVVLTGDMRREGAGYVIADPRIISAQAPFQPDPRHADGVLPQPPRGGEVKQFVHGGTAISLAGSVASELPNSTVQSLLTGATQAVTATPGYTETTIFSPDERLGLTMTTRFSPGTDLAVLGLLPRPYAASLNMGLSLLAYSYGVTGVREARPGNIGPALIDIERSEHEPGYKGIDLNSDPDWVFFSPMSWHPGGRKAMWIERQKGTGRTRIRLVELPDYRPAAPVAPRPTPAAPALSSGDLAQIAVPHARDIAVRVYGRAAGYLTFRRTGTMVEKTYAGFADDAARRWSGSERFAFDPRGISTYQASLALSGASPGAMDLTIAFGPLGGPLPARILFDPGPDGTPRSHGFVTFQGQRLSVSQLQP